MYEWLMGVEYDVYRNVVYFLLYLNCENSMKLLNYYGDVVGVCICYVHICCWWIFLHAIGVEFLVKACTLIAVEIVVNICIVDRVICSCITCGVGCLHPYCRWPDTCIHIAVEIIAVDNDVQLASGVTTSKVIWYHTCLKSV